MTTGTADFHGVRYQVKDVSRSVAFYTQHRVVLRVANLPSHIDELKKAGLRFRNEMEVTPAADKFSWKTLTAIHSSSSSQHGSAGDDVENVMAVARAKIVERAACEYAKGTNDTHSHGEASMPHCGSDASGSRGRRL